MEQELTPWFSKTNLPPRAGVYNVSCRSKNQTGRWYCWFDGECWGTWWEESPDECKQIVISKGSGWYLKSWRGLAHPPKEQQ